MTLGESVTLKRSKTYAHYAVPSRVMRPFLEFLRPELRITQRPLLRINCPENMMFVLLLARPMNSTGSFLSRASEAFHLIIGN